MDDPIDFEEDSLYERACKLVRSGVRIRRPRTVTIRGDLQCGADVEIDAGVIVEGSVRLGDGVRIGAYCILIDSQIGAGTVVHPYSLVHNAVVGEGSRVGPYARLRPGTATGDEVQIGNFVEIKESQIGSNSRINHLTYIGDAVVGERVTIGAGTITCNHRRTGPARTTIGHDAYIGSGTELVAPISIGENATIGAGSTLTKDAPAGMLTIARAPQTTLEKHRPNRDAT